jgi:hypothetical protein
VIGYSILVSGYELTLNVGPGVPIVVGCLSFEPHKFVKGARFFERLVRFIDWISVASEMACYVGLAFEFAVEEVPDDLQPGVVAES